MNPKTKERAGNIWNELHKTADEIRDLSCANDITEPETILFRQWAHELEKLMMHIQTQALGGASVSTTVTAWSITANYDQNGSVYYTDPETGEIYASYRQDATEPFFTACVPDAVLAIIHARYLAYLQRRTDAR